MAKHILLVEDNSDDEVLAVRALKKANIDAEIVVVRDGAEALEYLFAEGGYSARDPRELPTLILLDLKLPKIDGLEVLKKIRDRKATRYLPVVVFTSSGEATDLTRSYENGATSYVRKPVDFEAFARTTRQMADYWLSVNEPSP